MKKQLLLSSMVGVILLSNFSYADNKDEDRILEHNLDRTECAYGGATYGDSKNSIIRGGAMQTGKKTSKKELLNTITSYCSEDETCGKSKDLINICKKNALRQIDMRNLKK